MRKTRGRAGLGLRLGAVALAVALGAGATGARAANMDSVKAYVQYTTTGSIGTTGITGTPVVSFAAASGAFTAPSAFHLGDFIVAGQADGQTTTYNNTPFSITFQVQTIDHGVPVPNGTPFTLTGVLNGSSTGSSQTPDLVATFDPIQQQTPFRTGDFVNTLTILHTPVLLVPQSSGGRTSVEAQDLVKAAPVPEPATIAVFLTAAAGLAIRRRLRRAA